jgi:hypothetical protein
MSVICYVEGGSFPNIFGGRTACPYGEILLYDMPKSKVPFKWHHRIGTYELWSNTTCYGGFDTLDQAKEAAQKEWPGCTFKTPQQYRDEG